MAYSGKREAARRRWAAVGWLYGTLLILGVLFVGVIYVGFVASLRQTPWRSPLRLARRSSTQTTGSSQGVWVRRVRGNRWLGGFSGTGEVTFNVQYFVPEGSSDAPEVTIPKRSSGSRIVTLRPPVFAADFARITIKEATRQRVSADAEWEWVS